MPLEALIFDVDGTLADTEETHRQAFNAAFIQFELWWDWSPQRYVQFGCEGQASRIRPLPLTTIAHKYETGELSQHVH